MRGLHINIGMPNNAVQVRLAYITAADITPSSLCRARHSPVPVLSGCTLTRSLLLPQSLPWEAVQAKAWIVLELQGRLKRANIECVVLEGSSLSLCKCESDSVHVGPRFPTVRIPALEIGIFAKSSPRFLKHLVKFRN